MKIRLFGISLLLFFAASVNAQRTSDAEIDSRVADVTGTDPGPLAFELTHPYSTEREKVRAIYSWIAGHISYETLIRRKPNPVPLAAVETDSVLVPEYELVARDVLRKRLALCYGYARLFKSLCDHAGVRCEIVNGYARGDINRISNNFRTNHSWNAVYIDSVWHLVDVTWGSGYFTYGSNEFVKRFDEQYFFTAPASFALDHFPDNLKWSLLDQIPAIGEFAKSPYRARCFGKYNFASYFPGSGTLHAAVGDTLRFELRRDGNAGRNVAGGSLYDEEDTVSTAHAVYCKPTAHSTESLVLYEYIVVTPLDQWIQLVYNDDLVLRYKLVIDKPYKNLSLR